MLSPFVPWSADECIRAFECEGEKPHQGVASKKSALHLGHELCNSTTALGLQSLAVENRVRSRCTGKERDANPAWMIFLQGISHQAWGASCPRILWAAISKTHKL